MAKMFSTGPIGWMLWQGARMPPLGTEDLDIEAHFFAHVVHAAKGQSVLVVHPWATESWPRPRSFLLQIEQQ